MRIDLPYDTKTVPLTIGEQNLEKIVISHISEASGEGTQEEMVRRAGEAGVGLKGLSAYYMEHRSTCPASTVILGYAALRDADILPLADVLREAWQRREGGFR